MPIWQRQPIIEGKKAAWCPAIRKMQEEFERLSNISVRFNMLFLKEIWSSFDQRGGKRASLQRFFGPKHWPRHFFAYFCALRSIVNAEHGYCFSGTIWKTFIVATEGRADLTICGRSFWVLCPACSTVGTYTIHLSSMRMRRTFTSI